VSKGGAQGVHKNRPKNAEVSSRRVGGRRGASHYINVCSIGCDNNAVEKCDNSEKFSRETDDHFGGTSKQGGSF
jgi:hypothetical protein